MKLWEYLVVYNKTEEQLDKLGAEGWELVTVVVVNGWWTFYLKRERQTR